MIDSPAGMAAAGISISQGIFGLKVLPGMKLLKFIPSKPLNKPTFLYIF